LSALKETPHSSYSVEAFSAPKPVLVRTINSAKRASARGWRFNTATNKKIRIITKVLRGSSRGRRDDRKISMEQRLLLTVYLAFGQR
jgi:hypothetical protein